MVGEKGDRAYDFANLIAPLLPVDFLAEYWERKPYHCRRGDKRYYQDLLTPGDLERIIASTDLRYPALQLAKGGAYLPPEVYTRNIKHGSEYFNGVPDIERVKSEYRTGASIVLPAWHLRWPALGELCNALEDDFDHPVHANAYLTPGNSLGFSPHYDTHEVFVLQIGGHKHWQVYEPPLQLPHGSQPFNPTSYRLPPAPHFEFDLSPGDLLYLPRGYVHTAATSAGFSAHVTVGITVYTWVELVTELLSTGIGLQSFRKALPAGFATHPELSETLLEGLFERIAELQKHSDDENLVSSFTQRVKLARARAAKPFNLDIEVVGLQTRLLAPDRRQYTIEARQGDVILRFKGKTMTLPGAARPILDLVCNKSAFCVQDMQKHFDESTMLALVRYLHGEGFLTKVD